MEGNKGFFFARDSHFHGAGGDFEFRRFGLSRSWVQTVREIRRFYNIEPLFIERKLKYTFANFSYFYFFPTFHFEFFWSPSKGIELSISLENRNGTRGKERGRERKGIIQRRSIRITRDLDLPRPRRRIDIIPLRCFFRDPEERYRGCPLFTRDTSRNSILRVRKLDVLVVYHRRE